MADPFEFDPRDARLLTILLGQDGGLDEARKIYVQRAEEARPHLERIAASYGLREPAEIVDAAIVKGFECIVAQFNGDATFVYQGPMSLPTWISSCILGGPAAPGLVQGQLNRERRREHSLNNDNESVASELFFELDIETALSVQQLAKVLEQHLARLKGTKRFAIEARFGLPVNLKFDREDLRKRCQRACVSVEETKAIVRRIKNANIAPDASSLEMHQIAILLDLSDPYQFLKRALDSLRKAMSDLENPFREAAE